MKLKFSRKDVVPLITTVLFCAWIALWVYYLVIYGLWVEIYRYFYLALAVPWIILIIIVWINWKNIYEKIRQPSLKQNHFNPLYIRSGLVRLFQIIIIFIIFIYFIMLEINAVVVDVPVGLLVVVNSILAYFGFKPSDILPRDYVIENLSVEVPINKQLLTSLHVVKDCLNEFDVKFKATVDHMEDLFQKSKTAINEVITDINQRLEELEKIGKNIPVYTFSRDPFDKYSYLLFVILLAVINLISQPVFNIPSYIALPTFSIFGVLIGISSKDKINRNISNRIYVNVQALKEELSSYKEDLSNASEISTDLLEELNFLYDAFIESNFLDFLPANYASLLSIAFVSFLALFIFIIPLPTPEAIFTTIQWFVISYFVTKQ